MIRLKPKEIKAANKYRNKPQQVGKEKYRSKKEMIRHQELMLLERAKQILHLQREVPYVLAPGCVIQGRKRPEMRYYADFIYLDNDTGKTIIEDAKGMRTEGYRLKRHLMKTVHGIDILET